MAQRRIMPLWAHVVLILTLPFLTAADQDEDIPHNESSQQRQTIASQSSSTESQHQETHGIAYRVGERVRIAHENNRLRMVALRANESKEQQERRRETSRLRMAAYRASQSQQRERGCPDFQSSSNRMEVGSRENLIIIDQINMQEVVGRMSIPGESGSTRVEIISSQVSEEQVSISEINTAEMTASSLFLDEPRLQLDNRSGIVALRHESWRQKENSAFSYSCSIDYLSDPVLAFGRMSIICTYCGALKWKGENPGMCCNNGKVHIPAIDDPPEPLYTLLTGNSVNACHFQNNIRRYNACFQMTSFGTTKEVRESGYMPTFKIQGQVYHRIGSLLPLHNEEPKFMQIYFMSDGIKQAEQRCNTVTQTKIDVVLDLQRMLHRENTYVQSIKYALENLTPEYNIIIRADKTPVGEHERRFNAPTTSEVAVILAGEPHNNRDIVITLRNNSLQRIAETHRSYDALQYPLIFWKGDDGYHFQLKLRNPITGALVQKKLSAMDFYAYRIMVRHENFNLILRYKELFYQFIVDMYAKIEAERLRFIRLNQRSLRVDHYINLRDAISSDGNISNVGRLTILPSTFTGSPRYMHERTQDAMTYVRNYGRPDLFITFTCNPAWVEVADELMPGQKPHDRHDLLARVFRLKLKTLMNLLKNMKIFGAVQCSMYTIEWQKRGLPHSHILLWLKEKIHAQRVDDFISAELPNPVSDPVLFNIVKTQMVHGPCGNINWHSPCMKDKKCSKKCPRKFLKDTQTGQDGYPLYRRRSPQDGGVTTTMKVHGVEVIIDNSWIVPYCPFLSLIFNAHINVEYCHSVKSIKYVCKYVNKGSDMAIFGLTNNNENIHDEIQQFELGRVKNWALKFGVDLWEFGRHFTKMNQIQNKYHDWDLEVARKDGLLLVREMAAEVKNLMDFKMSAVMRIMDSAEQAALSGGAGVTPVVYYDARRLNVFGPDGRPASGSRRLHLTPSRHFDHLSVNTTHSAILVPPFLDEEDNEVLNQIAWSEHLDPLFANNYESDPALSWQYFGSSTGFLRRFPAISWPPEDGRSHHARDFYDFRSSAWFVEAATSPKDIVILLDVSSSATSHRAALAKATAAAILDTLGPNDFVNIFAFSDVTEELIPCYKNMLIQASPENVRELKYALETSQPTNNDANFTAAFTVAFEILHKYNRTGQGCQCNQAAMLISGGATGAPRDVFRAHNWPHMPVRVFTYLAGSDAPGAAHMQWIACSNKGFYARINSNDEIKDKVFNYVAVMARPMVMYQADHPIQWSPAYVGGRGSGLADDGQGQMMTSVTTPIFDRRNHTQREANLLGVVGTDVPIDQIKKLVPPYKLGANGYSFIINNNGHVLYHPDLRPLYNNEEYTETLRPLYSSVDITEMELSEQEATPRENHSLLLDLRSEMIEQKEGETEVAIKVHYEDMRRVSTRRQRYFYGPIDGTPFSLAVVLPDGYGMYELLAEQELRHSPINVTEYFKGDNWKVHPDWVYCEYNSASEINFQTAEERLLHFLARAGRPGWKWMSLRPRSPSRSEHHHFKKQEKDSYYCDKTLLQSLVRDAMVMEGLDAKPSHTGHKQQGYQMFGVTLSFVATRSGLLRWTEHVPRSPDSTEPHFSEIYQRAFDASWYKRAVDHHSVEPESFVFSVPFKDPGVATDDAEPLVLATHAVFVEHRGHRAPAAVVGLHFQLHTLAKHFVNITSACTGSGNCKKNCASQDLDCYILDDNGFVILSEETSHTGQFFGQIDGTIMDSLVQDRIYRKVPLFDYQGRCPNGKNPYSAKGNNLMPTRPLQWFMNWTWKTIAIWFPLWDTATARAHSYAQDDTSYSDPAYGEYEDQEENYPPLEELPPPVVPPLAPEPPPPPPQQPAPPPPPLPPLSNLPPTTVGVAPGTTGGVRACDKRTDLYVLQAERLNMSQPLKGKLTNCHVTGCERPFSVQKIPHSNLILLVVDTLCPCGVKQLGTGARELPPSPCRAGTHSRRRPHKCINYHPEEIEIQLCGSSNSIIISMGSLFMAFITFFANT